MGEVALMRVGDEAALMRMSGMRKRGGGWCSDDEDEGTEIWMGFLFLCCRWL